MKLWSKLIEKNVLKKPRYSTALNLIALYGVASIIISGKLDNVIWMRVLELFKKKEETKELEKVMDEFFERMF
jgi:hypothetical protein